MAYTYKDINGKEHELYDSLVAEEIIDVVTGEVNGYRVKGAFTNNRISKETYEAIMKIRNK